MSDKSEQKSRTLLADILARQGLVSDTADACAERLRSVTSDAVEALLNDAEDLPTKASGADFDAALAVKVCRELVRLGLTNRETIRGYLGQWRSLPGDLNPLMAEIFGEIA